MLTNQQLAVMIIKRVIFHDVPTNRKGNPGTLVLASAETEIDADQRNMLKRKLIRVLDAKSAYPIVFSTDSAGSPVPSIVRDYTGKEQKDGKFVSSTQDLGKHLHQVQHGNISPGLLCAIEFTAENKRGLALMKLERETGTQVNLKKEGNKTRFVMQLMGDLVLTDGTKLFKTAAFLRTGSGDDDFIMASCDSQGGVSDSSDMATFWLKYLGCGVEIDPRVATSSFFNTTIEFINLAVTDPMMKTAMYDSLQAELRSNKKQFIPKTFITEYVPEELQTPYRTYLQERHIPLTSFEKNVTDIKGKLNRKTYVTEKGVMVSAPEEEEELITVTNESIIVQDALMRVSRG
jgi:hypothetical protein